MSEESQRTSNLKYDEYKRANRMEAEVEELKNEAKKLNASNENLREIRGGLFQGVAAFVFTHERMGKIENEKDLVKFLKAVEHTDFYKDTLLFNKVNKMVDDFKRIYYDDEPGIDDINK